MSQTSRRTDSAPKRGAMDVGAGAAPAATPARSLPWLTGTTYGLSLALVTILGALIRLHGSGSLALNADEGATNYFAHQPLADLWGPPASLETNPPLFYTLVRGVVLLLGDGTAALRSASVAAGILCIPVAAYVAHRLGGRTAGLAAALLVATSATSVASSQDARTYSMLTLAALVAIAAEVWLVQAYRRPERRRVPTAAAWASYSVASIAALYLHNTAVVMVAGLNLLAAFCWLGTLGMQRRFAVRWIAANAVVAAACAPWLPSSRTSRSTRWRTSGSTCRR